jgi:hypothetical protein
VASKRELQALIVLAGKIDPSLQKAIRKAADETRKFNEQSSLVGKVANKGWDLAKRAVKVGALGIVGALTAVGVEGVKMASDLTEIQNVVDVTFGKSAKQIDDWSKTALQSFGLSELAAKRYTAVFGSMLKSSGISNKYLVTMSENLAALAADFASFYNISQDEAFEKIQSGLGGEVDPLQELGINMTVANLQAYALSKGIKTAWNNMDQATQTMLRYNYLLEHSKDAQGDFARTSGSFANQMRLLKTNFQQTAAKLMQNVAPALAKVLQRVNQLMDGFNKPGAIQKFQTSITNAVDKLIATLPTAIILAQDIGSALMFVFSAAYDVYSFISDNWGVIEPMILGIVSAMTAWKAITLGMTIYQGIMAGIRAGTIAATIAQWGLNAAVLANPMTWIVLGISAAIGVLVAGIYVLWKHWDAVSSFMVGIWQTYVLPFFQSVGEWFSGIWDAVLGGFRAYINFIISGINLLISGLNKINFDIPNWVPFVGGKHFGIQIPLLPTFAEGGFANQPSIFGEAGLEVAIPIKRTPRSLSLLNQTARMLGAEPTSGSPQFIFAPVIHGASGDSVLDDLKAAADDFFDRCDRWWESKRRESFGG